MANKLILFGASNFGDEIVQLFRDINKAGKDTQWDIAGFLDDNPDMKGKIRNGVPVLGGKDWLKDNHKSDYNYVCCIGSPKAKSKVVQHLKSFNVKFATGVHPSVIMSETTTIGEGTVVTAGNIFTTNINILDHVIFNLACTLGHYSVVHDYCTINPGVNISGDVILEEGVLIGTNATILEKITIGKYSIIGAGAVVNKNIPANVTAVGIPAKVIKENKE
ncbi:MAG: acetyltransferase [Bacteroidetes bacterium]|nr:acetyltransferase [Bacteroidota bacterium]